MPLAKEEKINMKVTNIDLIKIMKGQVLRLKKPDDKNSGKNY